MCLGRLVVSRSVARDRVVVTAQTADHGIYFDSITTLVNVRAVGDLIVEDFIPVAVAYVHPVPAGIVDDVGANGVVSRLLVRLIGGTTGLMDIDPCVPDLPDVAPSYGVAA